jgi:hypothetical protein
MFSVHGADGALSAMRLRGAGGLRFALSGRRLAARRAALWDSPTENAACTRKRNSGVGELELQLDMYS